MSKSMILVKSMSAMGSFLYSSEFKKASKSTLASFHSGVLFGAWPIKALRVVSEAANLKSRKLLRVEGNKGSLQDGQI